MVVAKTTVDSLVVKQEKDDAKREKQVEVNTTVFWDVSSMKADVTTIKDILQWKYKK